MSAHAVPLGTVSKARATRRSRWWLGSLAALFVGATLSCTGYIEEPDGLSGSPGGGTPPGGPGKGPNGGGPFHGPIVSNPAPTSRFVRLNHQQWENTVRDLFRLSEPTGLSSSFVAEPLRSTFDTNGSILTVSSDLRGDYEAAAETLAKRVVEDQALLNAIVPMNVTDLVERARGFIQDFGLRAFRRPLTAEETTRCLALFNRGPELVGSGDALLDGVELVVSYLLQSPNFLYRTELSTSVVAGKVPLNDYEVASKLSYGITNTMPDDELFAAAAQKQLGTRDGVVAQARRLLGTPKAERTVADLHDQLFRMREFETISKNTSQYREFGTGIGADLKQEGLSFVHDVVFNQQKGLVELLTAPYTFANSRVARIYGLNVAAPAAGQPDPFVRVDLPPAQRAGLLTQIGFLAAHAEGPTPSIILRGVNISQNVLCADLPEPPDMIPPLPTLTPDMTNRQRVEELTKNAPCSNCHATLINPLGFAFEKLDGVGAYRTTENGKSIDARGSYSIDRQKVSFDGPVELLRAIAASKQAHDCYARHLVEYLYGRSVDSKNTADSELVDQAGWISKSDGSVKDIIVNLVATDAFVTRAP